MSSNSSITKCPDDILLTIFSINSFNTPRSRTFSALQFTPLTLTRFTSQVCSHWRLLVLGSSLLWGRLLDLNDLDQKSNHWREEVLLRTKQAYLRVKVILDPRLPQIASFFFKILDEEWSRIQDLDASIYQADNFDDNRWLAIHRPTHTLRSFHLHFGSQLDPKPLRSAYPLFCHHAPSLRYLLIRWTTFQLPPNWLRFPQLHSLSLLGHFHPLPLLLSFSQVPPLIESLSVLDFADNNLDSDDSWPKIHFPQLQVLNLRGHLAACLMFLEHITIPEGCGLSLSTFRRLSHQNLPTSSIPRVLGRFSERFHKYHMPLSVSVEISLMTFTYTTGRVDLESPVFHFAIGCRETLPRSKCFEALLGCPFSQVANLTFETYDSELLPSDLNIPKFIALFSSVIELIATLETLQLLFKARNHDGIILPALKVLRPVVDKPEVVQAIFTFLAWRRAVDKPIEFLDLRDSLEGQNFDFSELENFSGMKIEWTTINKEVKVYICGSGNAQQLDFSTPPPVRGSPDVDNDTELDSDDSLE